MTSKADTSRQPASTHGCCGSQASKEAAPAVAAKPEAAQPSASKHSASTEAAPCCCHGNGPSDADHTKQDGHPQL